MFEYFYHEIFRKTIIGFGTLFNDISIKHTDSDGNAQVQKVPLHMALFKSSLQD